ncbi:MAG: DUF1579 domain-containing protein [Planctomycetaceae bacterium]
MKRILLISLNVLFVCTVVRAQDVPNFPQPQKEHEWLKQFAGDWETESKAIAGPDMPAFECKGTISSRMLGGFWVVNELNTDIGEIKITGVQTIGYDARKEKYVGTWVDSVMDYMWKYEGDIDETGKILTLEAEGPNMMAAGETAMFRDVYEFKSKDQIVMKSQMQGEDGEWVTFMEGTAKRKKK